MNKLIDQILERFDERFINNRAEEVDVDERLLFSGDIKQFLKEELENLIKQVRERDELNKLVNDDDVLARQIKLKK
jgi:hypothetical protein